MFQALGAVAEEFEAKEVSIINGREVKTWTKLTPMRSQRGEIKSSPAADQDLDLGAKPRLVPSGWDHRHCELCSAHIDAGDFGYCDPDERWICEKGYEVYVVPRDLSRFVEDEEAAP